MAGWGDGRGRGSGGNIPTAEYTDEHQVFGGISFPTLRRAVGREADGTSMPDPTFVTIDIEHVLVESVE